MTQTISNTLSDAQKALETIAAIPHGFSDLETSGPGLCYRDQPEEADFACLAVWQDIRVDCRQEVQPQVVEQLLALSEAAFQLAVGVADQHDQSSPVTLERLERTAASLVRREEIISQRLRRLGRLIDVEAKEWRRGYRGPRKPR